MDLHHYFDAVDFVKFEKEISGAWKYSLGSTIEKQTLKLRDGNINNVEIALVGVPFHTHNNDCSITPVPHLIRKELYQLSGLGKLNIIDFGDLKQASSHKGNYLALRDVVDYMKELGAVTIVLGGSQDFTYGIAQAFRNHNFFSFCAIDAFLDIKKGKETFNPNNYLSRIFNNQPELFHFSLLGYQSHYVADEYLAKTKGMNSHIRLGLLREDLILAEPVFRNSDFLSFDFAAMKHSDAPGDKLLPNGIRSEEACQLARYAGLSNRLNVFGLFGVNENVQGASISLQLAAQVIWYFIDGFLKRNPLNPGSEDGFIVYKVEISDLNSPLIFHKNTATNQWWIEVQAINSEVIYVACSEKDYLNASNNEIPQFWLKYIQKIDEILK